MANKKGDKQEDEQEVNEIFLNESKVISIFLKKHKATSSMLKAFDMHITAKFLNYFFSVSFRLFKSTNGMVLK